MSHAGIPVVGVDSWSANLGCSSRLCQVRICPSPLDEAALVDFFIQEGQRLSSPGVLLFAKDEFAVFGSRYRHQLSKYFKFVLPEEHVSEAMVDKQSQYEIAESLGVPYPHIYTVRTPEDLEKLQDGARYVITEGRNSGTAGVYRPSGEIRTGLIAEILLQIDVNRIIFEAPKAEH